MIKEMIQIDYDYYESDENNFQDLKEAVSKLTGSTEKQFEEIKKEKWFNRVFDMITFSKKNEKRMSGQIGNLVQAQQLLMEILLRLSNRDRKISDFVTESFEKIEKLSKHDIELAKKVKQLENTYILGIGKQTDISDLSDTNKQVLGGMFNSMMNKFEEITEEQQNYANKILKYLGVEVQQIDLIKSIDSIDSIDSKKKY